MSYRDVILKRNEFLSIFLSTRFGEKYKYTELDLNVVQKQYFSYRNTFFLHFSRTGTPLSRKKLFLKL